MSTVVTLRGPMSAGAIAVACEHVDRLLRLHDLVTLAVEDCDLSVVDAVARMRLLARRYDGRLAVTGDRALFAACGLADVCDP